MKKLLLVLLGLSVALAGCGESSADEKDKEKQEKIVEIDKDELVEIFNDMSTDEFEEKLADSKYTEVYSDLITYYISSDYIKDDKIDIEELEEEFEFDQEGELYVFMHFEEESVFLASSIKEAKDGLVQYGVYISSEGVELRIALKDEDGEIVARADYFYEEGKLELYDEDDSEEFEDLIDEHEKKALEFYEEAFIELDSVIN